MNIGSLYLVKNWSWLLFPTKETALVEGHRRRVGASGHLELLAAVNSAWYSKCYSCNVTYFSPDSIVVFLEEDGLFKKVLTSDGLVGWTWFNENYNHCFEEVKSE